MLKRTGFVFMAVAGLALSTGPMAAAAEVARYTFSGAQASFAFTASTSLTCSDNSGGFAVAFGYLQGGEQISTSTGSPPYSSNGTYVQIDAYFNSCTGVSMAAIGSIAGGFTAPDKKLTSAGFAGSGTVQDFNSTNSFPVSLDLQLVGVGNTNSSKSNSHSKTTGTKQGPLSISHDHGANTNRAGEASGSLTIDGVTFTDISSFNGFLNSNSSASVSIAK